MPEKSSETPESEVELIELPEPEEIDPIVGHEWRQEGPFILCKSCEMTHALYIGMNKELVGFDEQGKPILKKR